MATTGALMTVDEFRQLPDMGVPTELVRGQVVMMNVPYYRHGLICGRLARIIGNFVEEHDLGTTIGNDSGVVTQRDPDSVRGPDLSFYSYERIPKDVVPDGYPDAVPELVIEVRSPSDRWKDILAKVAEYLNVGITTVCVVDSATESVTVYSADNPALALGIDDVLTLPEVLPGFSAPVRKIFHA